MVYTYVIDESLFKISPDKFDVWAERVNSFFRIVKKNSLWLDCLDEGNHNLLLKKYYELHNTLDDDLDRKILEELWFSYFNDSGILLKNFCDCEDVKNCAASLMVSSLRGHHSNLPSHVLHNENTIDIGNIEKVNFPDYHNSDMCQDLIERSAWQAGPIIDDSEGVKIMKDIWGPLILILNKEITILDRNVFEKWNSNYDAGLRQFIQVINDINPSIKLKIISRKNRISSKAQGNKRNIESLIGSHTTPRIEIILAERSNLFDHGRFIMFDNVIAGKLERGLDEFHSTNQQDECRVSYWRVTDVDIIFRQALNNQITSGEFASIRNY